MIYGIGVDIVENKRVAKALNRWKTRFLKRAFSEDEIKLIGSRPDPVEAIAIRFAAKEAFSKALKTGLREGIFLKDIEMLHHPSGEPFLRLNGKAQERAKALAVTAIHVSVSHERDYSVATVILEV